MENKTTVKTTGVTFWGLLQLALIVLKLCDVIKWSWALIFIPTYVSILILIVVVLLIFRLFKDK